MLKLIWVQSNAKYNFLKYLESIFSIYFITVCLPYFHRLHDDEFICETNQTEKYLNK